MFGCHSDSSHAERNSPSNDLNSASRLILERGNTSTYKKLEKRFRLKYFCFVLAKVLEVLARVVEPNGSRPVQHSSTCLQEPRKEYPPTRGLGSGLVSLIPYLGDALGVAGRDFSMKSARP